MVAPAKNDPTDNTERFEGLKKMLNRFTNAQGRALNYHKGDL
jgi:hypothetical protein